ncbi:hypothetical protein ACFL4N_03820 [Thermodesulfobacteriota bacterium]
MFITWASLSVPYSGNGGPEPHRWGDLPLDFDDNESIQQPLTDLRALCTHLDDFYGIDPHELKFYLSGGKGFHCILPAHFLGAEDGDPRLPLIYKNMAARWKEALKLTSLDMSLYCMKQGRMLRLENVKRANGFFKVRLTLEEVVSGTPPELMALGKQPRKWEDVE